jgi:hypothetical protein
MHLAVVIVVALVITRAFLFVLEVVLVTMLVNVTRIAIAILDMRKLVPPARHVWLGNSKLASMVCSVPLAKLPVPLVDI